MGIDGDTWPCQPTKWPSRAPFSQILHHNEIVEPSEMTLEDVKRKSDDFPVDFPTDSMRCRRLEATIDKRILENNINSAYPLIHEQALFLFANFLAQKRRFGSKIERDLYANMTLLGLVDRLLSKRAVAFFGPEDKFLLMDGSKGGGNWETIGTADEAPPLTLKNCLSYDEIKLSALLGVSSPSCLSGGGNAVVVGVVGARLNKEKVMEYREVMKTKKQNTYMYGYGQFFVPTMQGVFTNFYGDVSLAYAELQMRNAFKMEERYVKISKDEYFDKWVYGRRIALSIDTLLVEANDRAGRQNKSGDLHVVGLGLEKWKIILEQDRLFLDTFKKRIKFLGKSLRNIENIWFSPIGNSSINEKVEFEGHPQGGINLGISDKYEQDQGKLVVLTYNWNGNALPGNEYWLHNSSSDDATIADLSQITELHNPHN